MTQMSIKYQFLKKNHTVKKSSLKYFIGYNDNDEISPLFVKLPQMIGFAKYFDSNETMFFKISDKNVQQNMGGNQQFNW